LGGVVYTAIQNLKANESIDTSKGIYTLNGTRIQATDLNQLPRGIYIINNKKILVK